MVKIEVTIVTPSGYSDPNDDKTQCSCGEWVDECYNLHCGQYECRYCDECEPDTWTCERDNCGNSDNCNSCDDRCTYCDRPPGIEGVY